jgi:hypothetical protein
MFRGAPHREQAARLLEQVLELEPDNREARLELAVLRAKFSPTPAAAWRWLRAALFGR